MKPWVLLLSLLFAGSADAANLVVPAAGPLVITTAEPQPVPVRITFYGPGDLRTVETRMLAGTGTIDVPAGATMIRVSSDEEGGRLTAHAAHLPAIPIDALPTDHVLNGSIVVANPWKVPASLVVTFGDRRLFRIVPPLDVLEIDVPDTSVRITSQVGVYAYDGRSFAGVPAPALVEPRCAEPAPLATAQPGQHAAGEWIVLMNAGTSAEEFQVTLPARHGYMPLQFYAELPGFLAELTPQQIAAVRCEAPVQLIAQNVVAP